MTELPGRSVTALLAAARAGEEGAVDALLPLVYEELRRIAHAQMRRERPGQTLDATALVHEAWLRLGSGAAAAGDRTHFLGIAARLMRQILVERARARHAAKRGGVQVQVTLNETILVDEAATTAIDLIALDRALDELTRVDAQQARVVELRYFGGLSVEETAEALKISPATVKRDWTVARAWLLRAMEGAPNA